MGGGYACTGVCAYSLLHQQGCRSRILSWKSLILRNMWGFAADLGDSSAKRFVSHLRSKIAATACVVVNAACPMALFRLVEGCMLGNGAQASEMASSPASTKPESACRNGIDKCNMGNTKCLSLMADGPKNQFALSASIAPEHQSITHKLQWGTWVTMITVNVRVPKRIHQNVSPGSQCFDPENWASWNRYVWT